METLHGAEHTVIPDRIVTATYLCAAAITGGDVEITGVENSHIDSIISTLTEAGCELSANADRIRISRRGPILPVKTIRTMPYPGFPTDAQAFTMSVLTLAAGTSVFIETIFENRYKHVDELCKMGGDIRVIGRMAVVYGVEGLTGTRVRCSDLRGGAALAVAALAAEGVTEVEDIHHIDRGYEDMEKNLALLGAKIQRK